MKKRLLSVILVLVMVLGLLPTAALADDVAASVTVEGGDTYNYPGNQLDQAWGKMIDLCARDGKNGRVTMTLNQDWIAADGGYFTGGGTSGFQNNAFYVPSGVYATLDLNGHTINRKLGPYDNKGCQADGEVIFVDVNASLTLISSAADHGTITGGGSTNGGGGIHIKEGATVTLNNVYVEKNWSATSVYNALLDGYGGGIMMDGENIKLVLKNGSKITDNWARDDGGGVYLNGEKSSIKMDDTSGIDGNRVDDNGGGVYVDGKYAAISGGSISANTAGDRGGGIYVNGSYATIFGVKLDGNKVDMSGGGIFLYEDGAVVSGCAITNNTAGKDYFGSYPGGGGIFVNDDDSSLSGCTITGNKSEGTGGGVFLDIGVALGLSGKMIIKDNDGKESCDNLYVYTNGDDADWGMSFISGVPGAGSEIWLSSWEREKTLSASAGTYDASVFHSDDPECFIYWEWNQSTGSGDRKLHLTNNTSEAAKWQPLTAERTTVDVSAADTASERRTVTTGGYNASGTNYDLLRGIFSYASVADSETDYDAVYYYSDGYFADDPTVYNEHLATMSLNLAMSAFGANAGNTSGDYTNKFAHVKQLLSDIGCEDEDIYISDTFTEKPGTDTIGVAIASKQITVGSKSYTLVPVAIRGAGYESEWASNVTIGTSGEHAGFADAADQVTAQVEQYIIDHDLSDDTEAGTVKFWVVGYSRAGATANLTAKRLTDKYGFFTGTRVYPNDVYGYDFEAPQGGVDTPNNGNAYYNIHNIINNADIVPRVGPVEMGFKRYGVDHYVPGDATADTPTKTTNSSNTGDSITTYSDNSSWPPSDQDAYVTRRTAMLKQLAAVNRDVAFDDYFRPARMNLVFNKLGMQDQFTEVADEYQVNIVEWENDFLSLFQRWAMCGTQWDNGVNHPETYTDYREFFSTANIYGGYTFQQALQVVIPIVFGKSTAEVEAMSTALSSRLNDIDYVTFTRFDYYDLYSEVLDEWYDLDEDRQHYFLDCLWNVLIASDGITDSVADHLTTAELSQLKQAWPSVASVLLQFVTRDYDEKNYNETLAMLGSLLYNSTVVVQTHYPEVNLAWLRSYDSFYNTETTAYDLVTSNHTVVAPTSTLTEPDGDPATADTDGKYFGSVVLSLDSANVTGEAIYFRLKMNSGEWTAWQLYGESIPLNVKSIETTYNIESYAMSFGKTSATASQTVKVKDDAKTVTVITSNGDSGLTQTDYPYRVNDTVTIDAAMPENKVFKEWKLKNADAGYSAYTPSDEAFNSQSAVTTFTMPEHDVFAVATFFSKMDTVELTEITAPTAGASLDDLAKATLKNGSTTPTRTPAIIWTAGGTTPASGTADYNTTYTANVIIPQETANEIYFSDSVTATVNGSKATVYRNNADGSVVVSYTFPATAKAKLMSITAPSAVSVSNGTSASAILSYLPQAAELKTEAGSVYSAITWATPTVVGGTEGETVTVNGTVTLPNDIDNANSVSLAVTATVTIEAAAKTAAPTASLTPGAYTANQTVTLSAVDEGKIYYTTDGSEPNKSSTEYTGAIALTGTNGAPKTFTIKAIAVKEGLNPSTVATFTYTVTLPAIHTVTVNYKDKNMNSSLGGGSAKYVDGTTVTLSAKPQTDEKFTGWVLSDGLTLTNGTTSDAVISFTMPVGDVAITANYIPVVSKIEVTLDAPEAGKALDTAVNSCAATITNTYSLPSDAITVTWTPTATNAAYNSVYTAKLALKNDGSSITVTDAHGGEHTISASFTFADQVSVTVNGAPATLDKATNTVYYTFPSTSAAKLVSVTAPSTGTMADYDTAWDYVKLPGTVRVSVQDRSVTSAPVTWAKPAAYSTDTLQSQSYTVTGTVTLPDGVSNADNVPLTVTTSLYVAAAPQVDMPSAAPGEGTDFTEAQQVRLSCETEGAIIRYTTDGTTPTAYSPGYTTPITVSSSTVIKAVAMKSSMRDSTAAMFTYTVTNPTSTGGSGGSNYTLTFDINGGSSISSVFVASGTTVDLAAYKPTKPDCTFAGWYSDSSLTTKVTSVKLTANTTVYAKWTEITGKLPFADVREDAYYKDAVLWAVEKGITSGTSATGFSPNAACTRAQAVTFLWRAYGEPEPTSAANPFTDVSADAYYYKAVLWAVKKGVTSGTSAAAFSPDAACTRAQIVTFQYRAALSPEVAHTDAFTDIAEGTFYHDAVIWAVTNGITNGVTDTTFAPNTTCTRAQIVTFLWRYLGK